jgi:hypothetical protein
MFVAINLVHVTPVGFLLITDYITVRVVGARTYNKRCRCIRLKTPRSLGLVYRRATFELERPKSFCKAVYGQLLSSIQKMYVYALNLNLTM